MPTECFFAEPTGDIITRLNTSSWESCEANTYTKHHFAAVEFPEVISDLKDLRFPIHCDHCGIEIPDPLHSLGHLALYRRSDSEGETFPLREAPPGAMWYADWMPDRFKGPDGHCLVVVTPDSHQWMVDGVASNCANPEDKEHRCWIRHGSIPKITVDKNGRTCSAGGGSIGTKNYHGFLREGVLT
jgi:hypothetical protein